jgi:hypothetical protein
VAFTTAALDMVAVSAGVPSFFLTKGRVLAITAGTELETDDYLFLYRH